MDEGESRGSIGSFSEGGLIVKKRGSTAAGIAINHKTRRFDEGQKTHEAILEAPVSIKETHSKRKKPFKAGNPTAP